MGTRHLLSFMKCRRPEPIPVSEVRKMVLSSTLPSHAIPTPARPTTGSTTPVYPLGKVKTVRSRCSRIARARQIESSFGGLPLRSPVYRRSCWGAPHQWTARPIRLVRNFSGAPIDKAFVIFFSLPNPRLVFFFFPVSSPAKQTSHQPAPRERAYTSTPPCIASERPPTSRVGYGSLLFLDWPFFKPC